MKSLSSVAGVYKQYKDYIDDTDKNLVLEPAAVFASSFNDMITVARYDKEFAADLLDVSYKTISRYQKEKKKFSPLQSEYILKTIVLYNKGERTFGNHESFSRWLNKPSFGMGNRIPISFITTVTGINHLLDELNRITHGDLA